MCLKYLPSSFWLLAFGRMVSFGMEDFAGKYGGLKPSQFVDLTSLMGDKSDNIPGSFVLPYVIFSFDER